MFVSRAIIEQRPDIWQGLFRRRLILAIALAILIVVVGTVGYWLIEGWSLIDSFYMTIITLTTVGFTEVRPLDTSGKIFTTALIVVGVAFVGYSATIVASAILESEFTGRARERRMQQMLQDMRDHVIICGFGRVGRQIALEFEAENIPFVVVDTNPDKIEDCANESIAALQGDASQDAVLHAAGISNAQALVSAVDNDSQNVFITLSARVLNPNINIVARAADPETERKLELAGADHVVSPYTIAGHRIAGVVIRPRVVEILDRVIYSDGVEFWVEDIPIVRDSALSGKSLLEAHIHSRTGAIVLAILHADGTRSTVPGADSILNPDDSIIAIGGRAQLTELEKLATRSSDSEA